MSHKMQKQGAPPVHGGKFQWPETRRDETRRDATRRNDLPLLVSHEIDRKKYRTRLERVHRICV
ncbi:hypothetical protein V1478_010256 [Vespula squamosa]|uniref:Uncharacterized protein n=1 Tax=Vespula squamosa TaxID=30214 RepID=A0ABD2ALX4_VESSQ